MYYACFRYKQEKKGQNDSQLVVKIPCTTRDEAREYISIHMDIDKYDQCWTE